MSIHTVTMKKHSQSDVTDQCEKEFGQLMPCVKHNRKPIIYDSVVGKKKYRFFTAVCDHEDCGKIAFSMEEIFTRWNMWNKPMKIFYTVEGWSNLTHLCTGSKASPVCGTHLNFPNRALEVRVLDGEVQQKWGDGELQDVKWVTTSQHDYCKRCLDILFKTSSK